MKIKRIPLNFGSFPLGYSAVGVGTTAAIAFSYQWLRPATALASSSDHQHQQQQPEKTRLHFMRERLQTVRNSVLKRLKFTKPSENAKFHQRLAPADVCLLAMDGLDVGPHFRQEFTLRGTFGDKDLARFEIETDRWKSLLKRLFKFQTVKDEQEELLLSPDAELHGEEEEEQEGLHKLGPAKSGEESAWLYRRYLNQWKVVVGQRRLARLVRQLAIQSEFDPECTHPLSKDFPRLLLYAIDQFRAKNEPLTVATLKVLANTVGSSRECAELITRSEWLPLLASMITSPVYDEERVLAHKILLNARHALGAEETMLPPHLYELHRPGNAGTPKLDIIFVHGLGGSAFRTWRQRDRPNEKTTLFWPKDWLAPELKQPTRMVALDYSSRFFRALKSMDSLEARSQRFLREFEQAGIGQRATVFICHSLGGLLVKQMLRESPQLLAQTLGAMFIATPHRGTPVATQLARNFLRPSEDVLLLRTDSEWNRTLEEHFARVAAERIPLIWTVLECEKTPISRIGGYPMMMMLVPIEYGIFGRGTVYHLSAHHHHLCKPEHRHSEICGIVRNFVNDSLHQLKMEEKKNAGKLTKMDEEKDCYDFYYGCPLNDF